jgi:hypothetical protein
VVEAGDADLLGGLGDRLRRPTEADFAISRLVFIEALMPPNLGSMPKVAGIAAYLGVGAEYFGILQCPAALTGCIVINACHYLEVCVGKIGWIVFVVIGKRDFLGKFM